MTTPGNTPLDEYRRRLDARQQALERHRRQHDRLASARLAVFAAAAVIGAAALFGGWSVWWLAAPAALFLVLVVRHDRVLRARDREERAIRFYERGIARVEDRWAGSGPTGLQYRPEDHPYADDLDLFGDGSLFQLLSTARLPAGEAALAGWLLGPAGADVVRARQGAVDDLRSRLDLREALALAGEEIGASLDAARVAAWGAQPRLLTARWPPVVGPVLGALNVVGIVWLLGYGGPAWPLLLSAAASITLAYWFRRPVSTVLGGVNAPSHNLDLLAEVLSLIEREAFQAPLLADLRARLDTSGHAPSERIARLRLLVDLLQSRQNQFFAPVAAVLLWGTQFAWAIERWRAVSGPALGDWVTVVGEFEALVALANYAYEHPADPWPSLADAGEPCFEAESLTHPLLPASTAVRNTVRLGGDLRLLVVSGSNMSGKSTLLRSVGVNAVLAQAGAPVRAAALRLSPLAVGATLRVQDSLQAGRSRFFAEITRLRRIVDLTAGALPVLFLLDELLAGTNSHDRQRGGEAVVTGLVERGAIGLVTTHDLALAEIAGRLGARAANVHFEDRFEGGTMTFDYVMRPGVVRTSNALALMRAVGLDVE